MISLYLTIYLHRSQILSGNVLLVVSIGPCIAIHQYTTRAPISLCAPLGAIEAIHSLVFLTIHSLNPHMTSAGGLVTTHVCSERLQLVTSTVVTVEHLMMMLIRCAKFSLLPIVLYRARFLDWSTMEHTVLQILVVLLRSLSLLDQVCHSSQLAQRS